MPLGEQRPQKEGSARLAAPRAGRGHAWRRRRDYGARRAPGGEPAELSDRAAGRHARGVRTRRPRRGMAAQGRTGAARAGRGLRPGRRGARSSTGAGGSPPGARRAGSAGLLCPVAGPRRDPEQRTMKLSMLSAPSWEGRVMGTEALLAPVRRLGPAPRGRTGRTLLGVARSSGFVAFLAATGAVILGTRRPSRLPIGGLPARIYALHRALGIVAILARSCTWSRCGRTTSSSSPLLSFCSCPEPPCTSRSLSPWAG